MPCDVARARPWFINGADFATARETSLTAALIGISTCVVQQASQHGGGILCRPAPREESCQRQRRQSPRTEPRSRGWRPLDTLSLVPSRAPRERQRLWEERYLNTRVVVLTEYIGPSMTFGTDRRCENQVVRYLDSDRVEIG